MNKIIGDKKKCSKCGKIKPTTEFHKDRGSFSSACKVCRNSVKKSRATRAEKKLAATVGQDAPPNWKIDDLTRQARRKALVRLVRRHRGEFDVLVRHEKGRLKDDIAS